MEHLHTILTIQHMAERAAGDTEQVGPDEGAEMSCAYARLYEQAKRLNREAGWEEETFESTIGAPPAEWHEPIQRTDSDFLAFDMATRGRRARVLLQQLAGWAAGSAAAVALQARIEAEVAAAMKAPVGFGREAA